MAEPLRQERWRRAVEFLALNRTFQAAMAPFLQSHNGACAEQYRKYLRRCSFALMSITDVLWNELLSRIPDSLSGALSGRFVLCAESACEVRHIDVCVAQ